MGVSIYGLRHNLFVTDDEVAADALCFHVFGDGEEGNPMTIEGQAETDLAAEELAGEFLDGMHMMSGVRE